MKKLILSIISFCFVLWARANTYTVTDSSGLCPVSSLCWAIGEANINPGADTILFNLPTDQRTIHLSAVLSIFSDSTLLKGDIDSDGIPDIELSARSQIDAFHITSSYNLIEGFIINGFNTGIYIDGMSLSARENKIYSNYIGADRTGMLAMPNTSDGITIFLSNGNQIGDGTAIGRNIISGNLGNGIYVDGDSNMIRGNYIGMNVSGLDTMPNDMSGIYQYGGRYNIYGGTLPGEGNLISGNILNGIYFDGVSSPGAINCIILGNLIGTDITGLSAKANGNHGILLDGDQSSIDSNYVGNGMISGRNIISGNKMNGIMLTYSLSEGGPQRTYINNNLIGIGLDMQMPIPNASYGVVANEETQLTQIDNNIIAYNIFGGILFDGFMTNRNTLFKNSIFSNGLGIEIIGDAQGNIQPPTIDSLALDSILYGTAAPNALVQLFADDFDQGEFYIDTVRANSFGDWNYKLSSIPHGLEINAIQDSAGNSSMFSTSVPKFYIDGQILNGSIADTITEAMVFIYSADINTLGPYLVIDSIPLYEAPYQYFSNAVFPGKYLIYVVPNIDTYPNTLPTYYPNKLRWFDAVPVTITKDTILDIICPQVAPTSGVGIIKGRVAEGQGLNINKVQGPGDPFNGIDVSLIDKSTGSAIAVTSTDSDTTQGIGGTFQFDNIPDGSYLIHLDIAGVPIDTLTIFTVLGGNTVANIVITADSNLISFGTETGINVVSVSDASFTVYPNPMSDKFIVSYYLEKTEDVLFEIIGIEGNKIYSVLAKKQLKGLNREAFDLNNLDLSNGIYFLNLKIEGISKSQQIIILK